MKVCLNEPDDVGDLFAYGQIAAIFTQKAPRGNRLEDAMATEEDDTQLDNLLVEIRWLSKLKEVSISIRNQ